MEKWVTINGHHVLIGDDGEPVNKADKERLSGKRNISQLVPHKWSETDTEYKTALKQHKEAYDEKKKHTDDWLSNKDAAKKHLKVDPDMPADLAEFFGEYDEEGQLLKAKSDTAYKAMKEAEQKFENAGKFIERRHKQHAASELRDWKGGKDVPASQKSYIGFDTDNKTHIPYYDDLIEKGKGQLVEMSPQEYMNRIAYDVFASTMERTTMGTDTESIEKYAKMMQEGTKFHVGYINYKTKEQEGRHRALAAYINGYEKIPVWIFR